MVPNSRHNLMIKTTDKRANAAATVKVENLLRCFFADLHSHTSYSDGALIPTDAHKYAREVAKLDVFSLTDHLESVDDLEWSDTREVAQKANDEGKFVVIPGLEWTKGWGHINIFEPKTRRWPNAPTEFYKAIANANVVAKFNHPGDGTKSHGGLAYSEAGDKAIQMMEVRRAEEEQAFIRALSLGWHIAPDGSDDTHSPNWGSGRAWSGILAPGLSKRNIWHALKNRHLFSTLDRNCILLFSLNGATMGDIVKEPVKNVEIVAAVDEADDNDLIAKIELFEDGKVVQTDEPKSDSRRWETTCSPKAGKHYYFVKVTQADGNMLWSAPVWVTVAGK
ncbi:MAG: CehA/McbA family metallohydrolase [Planctomycetota bacterium]